MASSRTRDRTRVPRTGLHRTTREVPSILPFRQREATDVPAGRTRAAPPMERPSSHRDAYSPAPPTHVAFPRGPPARGPLSSHLTPPAGGSPHLHPGSPKLTPFPLPWLSAGMWGTQSCSLPSQGCGMGHVRAVCPMLGRRRAS